MVIVAIALVPLIGFLALTIDFGNCLVAQTALQNYVDAKALAHLKEEFGLPVQEIAIDHHVPLLGESVPQPDLQRGAWQFNRDRFDPFRSVAQPGVPAVSADVPMFNRNLLLGGFFGIGSQQLSAHAVSFVKRRHIVIIQDVSGSMNGTPLSQSQTALRTFVNRMASQPMPGDSMGLISFGNTATTLVPLALNDQGQIQNLLTAINQLTAPMGNGTRTDLGLTQAQNEFALNPDPLADHIAMLVTDGAPNDRNAARAAARALCNSGPDVHLNSVLINTGGGMQSQCGAGAVFPNVPPAQLQNILFTILSRQQVRLVE
jgi:hypothetical protein